MSDTSFQLLLSDGDDGEAYLDDGAPREQASAEAAPQDAEHEQYLADISAHAGDLTKQRWGLFYPDNEQGRRLCRILRPLVRHRARQQGSNCLLVPVPPGLDAKDALRWTAEVYPETWRNMEHRRPRYACIVGDLDGVSLASQQALGLSHFPGRIACEDEEAYEAYVEKVLDWEARETAAASKLLMYTVQDGTAATRAGSDHLVAPCARHCAEIWEEERHLLPARVLDVAGHDHEPDAQDFLDRVGDADPSVLLTVSHGSGPPRRRPWTPEQARERQGAMSFAREGVLMPSDVREGAFAPGGFWFYFACFGAGTPDTSAYHHWLTLLQEGGAAGLKDVRHVLQGLAPDGPFTSGLTRAALGNPSGPLNILGHLDLAWSYSFAGTKGRPKAARFADLLGRIVRGERAGTVLLDLQSWMNDAAHAVNHAYDRARAAGQGVDATDEQRRHLGTLWMELQDLRGYVLLGDPAAQRPPIAKETRAGAGFLAGLGQHVPPAAEVPEVHGGLSFAAASDEDAEPVRLRPVAAPAPAPATREPAPPQWVGTVSRRGQGPGREILLEFTRARDAADPYAFSLGHQEYLVRGEGGTYRSVSLGWEGLLEDLQAVAEPGADPAIGQRLGNRLREFLQAAGWSRIERELGEALEEGRRVLLTIRSAAAELFSLPWELLTLTASGRQLGALPGVLVRYEWPGTRTAPPAESPRPEGGRVLLGWSAAGGRVPHKDHQETLADTCARGFLGFDPARDVAADLSPQGLVDALQRATDAGEPVALLHLLCHGTVTGSTFGLALDGGDGRPVAVDPGRLRDLLAPFAGTLRAVVLCACYGGNPGDLSNHLGSVAQTLHRAGIATVISSRFPFSTAGSTRFSRTFYERLLVEPASLESAFLAARGELLKQTRSLDWASLQLYCRLDDGQDTRPIVFRPYRGLLAFQPQHARFFFGRDRERQSILRTLGALEQEQRPRYLVVAGASGTGKSSVVFAGAVPDLLGDTATARAAEQERIAAMVAQLEATLGHLGDDAVSRALATLQGSLVDSGPGGRWELVRMRPGSDPKAHLAEALNRRRDPSARLLLIIDQLEELFTLAPEQDRDDFARRLWSLARLPDSGVSVLTTIRVDFLGHCGDVVVDESGLRLDRVAYDENHRVFVAQMGVAEMRAAIVEPARKVGLTLEDGLAERMLAEVEGEPGALPVLSYTLDLLWQRREHGRLTQAAYEALGGVVGALHRKADSLLGSFDEARRTQARRLLVQLVGIRDDGALDTRRRVEIAGMLPGQPEAREQFSHVLDAFVDARLLVRGEEGGISTIEVAHEALIRKWDRLRDWVLEDKDKLQELQELKVWADQCKQYGTVLTGEQLVKATAVQSRFSEDLDGATNALIQKSHRRRRRRELAVRAIAVISVLAAIAFGMVGSYGLEQAQLAEFEKGLAESKAEQAAIASAKAEKEKEKAQEAMAEAHAARDEAVKALAEAEAARGEAVQARGEAVQQHQRAVMAAREALRQQEFAEMSESKARDTLRMLAVRELRHDPTRAVPFLKSVDARDDFPAWSAEAWHALQHPLGTRVVGTGELATEHGVAFDPSRDRLALGLADGRVMVVDSGAQSARVLGTPGGAIQTLAFSPDGRWLGVALSSGSVALYGGSELALVRRIDDPLGTVWTLDFTQDSSRLVFGSRDGKARVVSLPHGNVVHTLEHGGAVWTTDYDSARGLLLTASADGTTRIWGADGLEQQRLQICPQDRPCSALAARFDPSGRQVLASGAMNTAYVWEPASGRKVSLAGHGSYVVDAAFRPARTGQVATLTWDGVVRLFSVPATGEGGQLLVELPRADGQVLAMRFSGDGRSLATAHDTGVVRLWRLGEGGAILQSRRLVGHSGETVSAWFDGASQQVHTVDFDGQVRTWPVQHAPMSRRLEGVNGRSVEALGFTSDGQVLVARSNDGSVAAWTLRGEPTAVPASLPELTAASSAAAGGLAASAGSGGEVYISSPGSEGTPVVLREHYGAVHTLALSPDGRSVATASMDGALRSWSLLSLSALGDRLSAKDSPCAEVADRVQFLGESEEDAAAARAACEDRG